MNFITYLNYLKHLTCWFALCSVFTFAIGCSIIALPTYNESEYAQLIDIAVAASESTCKVEEVAHLAKLSNRVVYYSAYLPHNEHVARGVAEMDKTVRALGQAQSESVYCHLKLRAITDMATTLAQTSGGKPR